MSGIQAESTQSTTASIAPNSQSRRQSDSNPSLLDAETFSQLLARKSTQPPPLEDRRPAYAQVGERRSTDRQSTDSAERSSVETSRVEESNERPRAERDRAERDRDREASADKVEHDETSVASKTNEHSDGESVGETDVNEETISQIGVALAEQVVDAVPVQVTDDEIAEPIVLLEEHDEQNDDGPQKAVVTSQDEEAVEELVVDLEGVDGAKESQISKKTEVTQVAKTEVATPVSAPNSEQEGALVADIEDDVADRKTERSDGITEKITRPKAASDHNNDGQKPQAEVQVTQNKDGVVKPTGETGAKDSRSQAEVSSNKPRETPANQAPQSEEEVLAGSLSASRETGGKNARQVQNNDAQPMVPHAAAANSQQRAQNNLIPRTTSVDAGAGRVSIDSAKFLPRVTKAFSAAAQRGGEIRIRLNPPELGSIRLEVRMQGGNMTARMDAETPAARQALLDNLPLLRERLAEQGLRIEQLDIGTLDRQDRESLDAQDQGQQERRGNLRADEDARSEAEEERNSPESLHDPTSLDVVA